jgi:hypothetical protein
MIIIRYYYLKIAHRAASARPGYTILYYIGVVIYVYILSYIYKSMHVCKYKIPLLDLFLTIKMRLINGGF